MNNSILSYTNKKEIIVNLMKLTLIYIGLQFFIILFIFILRLIKIKVQMNEEVR